MFKRSRTLLKQDVLFVCVCRKFVLSFLLSQGMVGWRELGTRFSFKYIF